MYLLAAIRSPAMRWRAAMVFIGCCFVKRRNAASNVRSSSPSDIPASVLFARDSMRPTASLQSTRVMSRKRDAAFSPCVSAILRARKLAETQGEKAASRFLDITRVLCNDAVGRIESRAKSTLAGMSEGDELRTLLAALRRFTKQQPMNTIAARQRIAGDLIAANKYIF